AQIAAVARQASGFIYCVSLTGVTGARDRLSQQLPGFISRVRQHTDLPLVVGFGISTPEHVAEAGKLAEAVAVGSAVIKRLGETALRRQPVEMAAFNRYLRGAIVAPVPPRPRSAGGTGWARRVADVGGSAGRLRCRGIRGATTADRN